MPSELEVTVEEGGALGGAALAEDPLWWWLDPPEELEDWLPLDSLSPLSLDECPEDLPLEEDLSST